MRPLMDSASSAKLQRRTALTGGELDRYNVEIAALSETRLAEEGLWKAVGASYSFFWSGRKKKKKKKKKKKSGVKQD